MLKRKYQARRDHQHIFSLMCFPYTSTLLSQIADDLFNLGHDSHIIKQLVSLLLKFLWLQIVYVHVLQYPNPPKYEKYLTSGLIKTASFNACEK